MSFSGCVHFGTSGSGFGGRMQPPPLPSSESPSSYENTMTCLGLNMLMSKFTSSSPPFPFSCWGQFSKPSQICSQGTQVIPSSQENWSSRHSKRMSSLKPTVKKSCSAPAWKIKTWKLLFVCVFTIPDHLSERAAESPDNWRLLCSSSCHQARLLCCRWTVSWGLSPLSIFWPSQRTRH